MFEPTCLEDELRIKFLLRGIATGPATTEQINSVESTLNVQFPSAYRAYLRVCGTHPPKHLVGSDCVLGNLQSNYDAAIEILAEDGVAKPGLPMVVFLMHQGYYFEYFLIDGADDPPVYSYMEGDEEVQYSWECFSSRVLAIPGHREM